MKFSFRAKAWLEACGRLDLSEKVAKLHQSHRICGIHFSAPMFLKGKRKLLRKNAVPKRYVTRLPCDISIPSTSYTSSSKQVDQPEVKTAFAQTSTLISPIQTSFVQTNESLTAHTPRKEKLRKSIKDLSAENKHLKLQNMKLTKTCQELQTKIEAIPNEITLEQYKEATYKLCPSMDLANFINIQVSQINKSAQGRRFTVEFKYKCLSMYFSGPKLYKTLLTKLFCLPGSETLRKLIYGIDIKPGLENPCVFEALKRKVESFDELNRYCVLCIDQNEYQI